MLSRIISRRSLLTAGLRLAAFAAVPAWLPIEAPPSLTRQQTQSMLSQLQERWRAEISRQPFDTAVSVVNLQTGDEADVNGDMPRQPGCTINLLVLMRVVKDVQEGQYAEAEVGADIAHTIRHSSADVARKLLIKTGGGSVWAGIDRVNEFIRSIGLSQTILDHPPGYYVNESRYGKPNLTTANEMPRAIAALWHNQILSHQWSVYLLEKMTQVKPGLNYLIPAGVPANTGSRVGHKNGFFHHARTGWVDNDIGVVWRVMSPEHQYAYSISLFFQQVSSKYQNVALGQRLSRLTWDAFAQMH